MVESTEAVDAITDIASVPGVDGVLLGPSDLSLSAFGELHGDLDGFKAEVAQACHDAGVWAGIACRTPAQAAAASALGFQLILIGWDLALLETAEADLLGQSRLAVGFPVEGG